MSLLPKQLLLSALLFFLSAEVYAQTCNKTCKSGEIRDARGCCMASTEKKTSSAKSSSKKPLFTLALHSAEVTSLDISPDGTRIVTASLDKTVKTWDASSGTFLSSSDGYDAFHTAKFSSDGARIVTTNYDTVKVWNVSNGKLLLMLDKVKQADISSDGARIVSVSSDKIVNILDASNGKLLLTLGEASSSAYNAKFSPDGKQIITTHSDETTKLWDASSGKLIAALEGYRKKGVFSPDGTRIAVETWNPVTRKWDVVTVYDTSGAILYKLEDHTNSLRRTKFSADGTKLLTTSEDQTAKVWDASSGKLLTTFKTNSQDAEFSSEGKRILTVVYNEVDFIGEVKIWDVSSSKLLSTLKSGYPKSMKFSPDGTYIATAGEDGIIKIWKAPK